MIPFCIVVCFKICEMEKRRKMPRKQIMLLLDIRENKVALLGLTRLINQRHL
jgi:hypothetical protein